MEKRRVKWMLHEAIFNDDFHRNIFTPMKYSLVPKLFTPLSSYSEPGYEAEQCLVKLLSM